MGLDRDLIEVIATVVGGLAGLATFLKVILGAAMGYVRKSFDEINKKLDDHVADEGKTWEKNAEDNKELKEMLHEYGGKLDRHIEKPHYYDAVRLMHKDSDGVQ